MFEDKYCSNDYFTKAKGIILDNAYDLAILKKYKDLITFNDINYIRSQDVDMTLLSNFLKIEYLTVPEDAENVRYINNLKDLKGLQILSKFLNEIDFSNFEKLNTLVIVGQPKQLFQFKKIGSLKHLVCVQWDIVNFNAFYDFNQINELTIDFCRELNNFEGIQFMDKIDTIHLDYCLALKDIDNLNSISNNLKKLYITDCNSIIDYNVLGNLINLESISISNFQTQKIGRLKTVSFIKNLVKLKDFSTSYKIEDFDLYPLMQLENVNLFKYNKKYNVKENDLPKMSSN